jgi:uncharacterized protein (TIGR03000 family)
VKIPAEAELWFDDVKTAQDGSYRRCMTPPLTNGRCNYTPRVRWQLRGVELTRVEKIQVEPGGTSTINFLTAHSWTVRRMEP